ncbi:MAG TPA: alpha-amlyase, partial [Porphyromonadaceae bacterium]|nr:alpha-amlyase [Porphyromonadaceae bacterium]
MNFFKHALCGAVMASSAMASVSAATFVGDRTDFRDETIYFAMTTRFYDGDHSNNVYCWDGEKNINDPEWRGDFKGLIDKLDYIKALGFTAVWITPVVENASGLDYHGYHAIDFSKIDHRYVAKDADAAGAETAFQELIDEVHKRGMKLILDIVLQHTGNFGESNICPMFDKDYTKNLADINASMIPRTVSNGGVLPDNYLSLQAAAQYGTRLALMKNSDFTNHDIHNYFHHKAWFDWDDPSRWWGQIAGDCVDLNTENPAVTNYLVECYSRFIKMGVDGFRIDTAGHIPRLSFNKMFLPQFIAAAESAEAKAKRGNTPFFMYGEVCARSMEVIYRGQNYNCSPCYYTWKESKDYAWDMDASSWDDVVAIPTETEGSQDFFTVSGHTNWESVLKSGTDDLGHAASILRRSTNHQLNGNSYHTPDYTDFSGLNVIDFAMHWNFNSAAGAYGVRSEDYLYNDATYNVVYVDSHDYAPDSNYRFTGTQDTWAENLSLMFTFRGIPCIYYGSEVEFQKGKDIDKGAVIALKDSGRAYFGGYLEGDVTVNDFADYTGATGNLASTLSYPLARHIQRLNKIRAAVPALRKGQYTFDGCSANGGWAFKRAYKDESYALVAVNGGATFTNVPAGTYTDIVTGQTYQGGGTITVTAPATQGQLRVLVKDWNGGKVVEDGKFIYTTSPVAQGGTPTATDPGASFYYTKDDAIDETPGVIFSPAGGTFKTETLTVSVSLTPASVSGWYQVAGQQKVNITSGNTSTFTIGAGMSFGESISVTYGATSQSGDTTTGTVTYKKVDPTASITVYVDGPQGTNMYAWGKNGVGTTVSPCGEWPGKALSETVNVNGTDYYYVTFDDMESVNIILNKDGNQTGDIEGITEDTFFKYDGNSTVTKVNEDVTPVPVVKFSPNGGNFVNNVKVTATASNATSAWYKIGNGQQINISGSATFSLGDGIAIGESVTVYWSASSATETKTGSVTFKKVEEQV